MKIKAIVYLLSTISFLPLTQIKAITHELPLVISVCSYNVAPWVEQNLDSIFMQEYDNFRVVYIDDASSDDTVALVQAYIETHQLQAKITLQVNPSRCRKTKNIYNLFHTCADEEIIVQVDGDDWLVHDQVFERINQTYQNNDIWLTYSHYVAYPSGEKGCCKPVPTNIIEKRSFRNWQWVYTHLRTFKAWLFKNIKLEDFINERIPDFKGKFFPLNDDVLTYYPMLEMCGNKFFFIPETLYTHNKGNPLYSRTIDKKLYRPARRDVKGRAKYTQITEPTINRLARYENAQADLIILSKNNPKGAKEALISCFDNITGIENIYVLYESNCQTATYYQELQIDYPEVHFISICDSTVNELLLEVVQESNQEHIIITKDTVQTMHFLDVHTCIIELERTFAYGFYFGLAPSQTPFVESNSKQKPVPCDHIYKDIYTWKFMCTAQKLHNNLDMTLMRKSTFQERVSQLTMHTTIKDFIIGWQDSKHANLHNVGLFLETNNLVYI